MLFHRALFAKSVKDHLRGAFGWMFGVVALVVLQLSVYPTIRSSSEGWSSLIDEFPDVIKEIIRITDYTSEAGYISAELLSFIVPFIYIGLGCMWGARLTTEEEELGTADILLSLPISRSSIVFTRFIAATTVLFSISLAFFVSLTVGARMLDMSIPISRFVAGALVLMALGFLMETIAAALGALTGKRNVALGVSMAIAIALFVFYSLAPLVDFFDTVNPVNPFQWTIGTMPMTKGISFSGLVWTVMVITPCVAATYYFYGKRDVAG